MHFIVLIFILIVFALQGFGETAPPPADWPTYLHDTYRTGRQPVPGALVSVPRIIASYSLGVISVQPLRYVDLDGDGVTEALFLLDGRFSAQNWQGQSLWSSESFDEPRLLSFEDLDGDGKKEFLIHSFPPQLAVLSPADGRTRLRLMLDARATMRNAFLLGHLEPIRKGVQYFGYLMLETPTGDFAQGWVYYVVFDQGVEKGRVLWSRDMHLGAYPKVLAGDVNGDGKKELIAQSHSELTALDPTTGKTMVHLAYGSGRRNYGLIQAVNLDEEPDDEIVVLADQAYPHMEVLKLNGGFPHLRWFRSFWPENRDTDYHVRFTALPNSISDFDGDGRLEIAYSLFNDRGDRLWHIQVVDAWTGELRLDLPGHYLRAAEDLDGDGRPELLSSPEAASVGGALDTEAYTLKLFKMEGQALHPLGSIQRKGKFATIPHPAGLNQWGVAGRPRPRIEDADGDGRKEFFWISGGKETPYGVSKEGRLAARPMRRVPPALSEPPVRWKLPSIGKGTSLLAAHLTGDARPELLIEQDRALVALGLQKGGEECKFVELWRFPGVARCGWNQEWFPATATDIDGDGRHEVVVGLGASGQQIHRLGVLSNEGKLLRTLDFPEATQSNDKVRAWGEGDFNGDGLPEIAAFIYHHAPLGYDVIVFDPRTGKRLWSQQSVTGTDLEGRRICSDICGATVPVITARDIDKDGADDLIFGANAFNFTVLNGRNGEVLEAFHVINILGVTSGYGYPILTDLDGDGKPEVVMEYIGMEGTLGVFRFDRSLPFAQRKLWAQMFNSRNGLYMSYPGNVGSRYGVLYPAFGISDADGDGVREMLVPHRDGRVKCYNGLNGNIEWSVNIGSRPTGIISWDADSDGRDEFLFGADGRVYALRGNGKPLWVFETPRDLGGRADCVIAADLLGTGKPQLIVSANGHVYVLDR